MDPRELDPGSPHRQNDNTVRYAANRPRHETFAPERPADIIALMTNMEGAACEELVPQILEAIGQEFTKILPHDRPRAGRA